MRRDGFAERRRRTGREEALNQAAVSNESIVVLFQLKKLSMLSYTSAAFKPSTLWLFRTMSLSLPLAPRPHPWMPLVSQELFVAFGEPSPNEMVLSARRAKIAAVALSPAFFFPPSQSLFALCKCGQKR